MSKLLLKTSHFVFSFSLTFLLLKKFIPVLRKIIPVLPNERGMHNIVKPSSGGISFVLIYFVSGVRILEDRADTKWGGQTEYESYKASTPIFFPKIFS